MSFPVGAIPSPKSTHSFEGATSSKEDSKTQEFVQSRLTEIAANQPLASVKAIIHKSLEAEEKLKDEVERLESALQLIDVGLKQSKFSNNEKAKILDSFNDIKGALPHIRKMYDGLQEINRLAQSGNSNEALSRYAQLMKNNYGAYSPAIPARRIFR